MHTIQTRKQAFAIGAFSGKLRVLKDRSQFSDPDGTAQAAGICSASWSLFGQLWPASKVLAQAMKKLELKGQRILELGCGLGLPSLTLQFRGANITASDYHPVSRKFLNYNSQLNQLPNLPFIQLDWNQPNSTTKYDLIIASDVLYDPGNPKLLGKAINALATSTATVLLSCPGRGYKNQFSRIMQGLGFQLTETPTAFSPNEKPPYKGRLLTYTRA